MRSAREANRHYFRDAYETGRHGWEATEPSPYVVQSLNEVARAVPGGRLLDLGCGEGRHCILAAKLGLKAVGVDYEYRAIDRAREFVQGCSGPGTTDFLVADALALPFRPASFDVAVDYGCLHHQRKADWPRYRASVLSALKPTGLLLLSVFSTQFRVYGPQARPWHLAHGAYRRFFTATDLHTLFDRDFGFLRLEEERAGTRGFWHVLLQRIA